MNSPIIDVIALSERHRLQEKEAHESTKEALASALAEVERLKDQLELARHHLRRVCVQYQNVRNAEGYNIPSQAILEASEHL